MRAARFGDLFQLERVPLDVEPSGTYTQIGIRSFGKGIFHRDPVGADGLSKLRYFHVRSDRLVFSNIMAREGAVALTSLSEEGTVGSQRFLSYESISDLVDLRYINYFLQSDRGMNLVRAGSTGTVKRNQTLSPRVIEEFRVPLPPLSEQRRTAELLHKLLGQSVRAFAWAEQRQAVLPTLLPGIIDKVVEPFARSSVEVSSLAQIVSRTVHPGEDPGDSREFVGLEHIVPHLGLKGSSRPVGQETGRRFKFQRGDVLYGYLRPYQNKVWTATHPWPMQCRAVRSSHTQCRGRSVPGLRTSGPPCC